MFCSVLNPDRIAVIAIALVMVFAFVLIWLDNKRTMRAIRGSNAGHFAYSLANGQADPVARAALFALSTLLYEREQTVTRRDAQGYVKRLVAEARGNE